MKAWRECPICNGTGHLEINGNKIECRRTPQIDAKIKKIRKAVLRNKVKDNDWADIRNAYL